MILGENTTRCSRSQSRASRVFVTSSQSRERKQTVLSREELFSTRFLRVQEIQYTRPPNWEVARRWQMVERPSHQDGVVDAVCVLCIVASRVRGDQLVVVKQFRPALGEYTVELPAGLVDEGETVQEAALRELQEETGFVGTITGTSGVQYLSPGLTNECVQTVLVRVDGDASEYLELRQGEDESSFISVELLPLANLIGCLHDLEDDGYCIKAMLYSFAQGLSIREALSTEL